MLIVYTLVAIGDLRCVGLERGISRVMCVAENEA